MPVTVTVTPANVTAEQFTEWLKGFLDAAGSGLTPEQVEQIKQKLATVSPYANWIRWPVDAAPQYPNQPWYEIWCGEVNAHAPDGSIKVYKSTDESSPTVGAGG